MHSSLAGNTLELLGRSLSGRQRPACKGHSLRSRLPARPGGRLAHAAQAISSGEAHRLLGLSQGCSRAELRAAYLSRIRQLHPDVNQQRDTTEEAAALNQAYEALHGALQSSDGAAALGDVFSNPEGPAEELFINPFACSVSPLLWRELQEAVRGAEDPEQALARAGVAAGSSAVCYLTREQLGAIEADLEAMEQSMAVEITAWFVTDCLLRAARANSRMPVSRRG